MSNYLSKLGQFIQVVFLDSVWLTSQNIAAVLVKYVDVRQPARFRLRHGCSSLPLIGCVSEISFPSHDEFHQAFAALRTPFVAVMAMMTQPQNSLYPVTISAVVNRMVVGDVCSMSGIVVVMCA